MTAAPRAAPRAASSGTGIGPSFAPSSGGAPPPPPDGRSRKLVSPKPLARLLPLVRPYAPRLAVAALCLVVAGGAQLVFPQTVRHLLDAAFQQRDRGQLDRLALLLVGLFLVQGVMTYFQVYLLTGTTELVVARLREQLFAHLVRLSPGFFVERRTGELTSRIGSDTAYLQALLSTYVSEFARQLLFLVGGVVLLVATQPRLAATTVMVVPVVVGAAIFFGRLLRGAATGVQDRIAEATAGADEAFATIRTVQSFNREAEETRRYTAQMSDVVRAALRRAQLRAMFFGVVVFVSFAGVAGVLWQGGRLVLDGSLTAGTLVQFLLYALTVAAAVGTLASLFGHYQESVGAAQRVFELLDTPPTVREPAAPVRLARPARGDVRLEGVRFRYADGLPNAVDGVSLRIAPGEVVALVGPSGAGKTTVASLIPRFWDVTAGRVLLDGHDVRELALGDLRGAVGMVPQEPALFSGTVRENIAYARPSEQGPPPTEAEVVAAARAAHAWEFIQRLPEGLDTRVGERGVKLSGGQRQRLAIARVFLKNPAVVVLDEATSSLDTESERLVEEAMEELLQGRSTLIIAHRLSTVLRADTVVVLDHGRVVEQGTHDELLAKDGLYAKLYRGQFREG